MTKVQSETGTMTEQKAPIPDRKKALDAVHLMYEQDMAGQLKQFEGTLDVNVTLDSHYIVRLDGVAFSTFTRGVVKPFDERIAKSMVQTTADCVSKFAVVCGYTQSDEISLVFPATKMPPLDVPILATDESVKTKVTRSGENKIGDSAVNYKNDQPKTKRQKKSSSPEAPHLFGGRAQKLASVFSSYASVRFNYHLSRMNWDDVSPEVAARMVGHVAYFDGRICPLPTRHLVMNCIYWRSNFDGFRNAISHVSHAHFTHQQVFGQSLVKQLEMLQGVHVDPFRDVNPQYLFGTWIKKEQYKIHGMLHPKTGELLPHPVTRSRIVGGSFNWAEWTEEERIAFVFARFWPNEETYPRSPPRHVIEVQSAILK